jgi:FtsP/CotA-like multicopper oxidase with cupredoxin domain
MGSTPTSTSAADHNAGDKCQGATSEANANGSEFPQPQVRRSHHGVLFTALHACIATHTIVDQASGATRTISVPTFEGTIPGPTLVVKPGDKLKILLFNDLPANPEGERGKAFPHDEYSVNFHAHGLTVSPLGISDNIFREMEPGSVHLVKIKIPENHPAGTFWYHTHKHGAVTFQIIDGMSGFLIVKGGPGTLDAVPEVAAAKDVVMSFQVIRTLVDGGVPVPFVNEKAQQFGTFPFPFQVPGPTIEQQGVWSTYGLDGSPGRSFFYYTTNGVTNPTLHMRPGEVQRWRLLNATEGDNLLLTLASKDPAKPGLGLNVVAMDGITVENTHHLEPGDPLVMGPAQRMDVMVKARRPGTYLLETLDPATNDINGMRCCSVSPYRDTRHPAGIAPQLRTSRHSFDFPTPCSTFPWSGNVCDPQQPKPPSPNSYPVILATIVVGGSPLKMDLPADPLPAPEGLPSVATMLSTTPDAVRHVAFEICGNIKGTSQDPSLHPATQLPSCGWYYAKYGAAYWGGAPFNMLLMTRDDDDKGTPTDNPSMPLINFKKEGLFDATKPLFPDMIAGNYEEWTVINRSFSDHPFHMHQNHFLVTKINGITLPIPEWHDTFIVPAAVVPTAQRPTRQPLGPYIPPFNAPIVNLNQAKFGSITFRMYLNPVTAGCFVMHCHTLSHEDVGMMQRLDVLPAPGQSSNCDVDTGHFVGLPLVERLLASARQYPMCQ